MLQFTKLFIHQLYWQGDKLVDDNKLILKDADTESSNRYTIRILGDTNDALNFTYNTLPIEASKGVPYTAIFTSKFQFYLSLILSSLLSYAIIKSLDVNQFSN